ncbi:hypothetical protein Pint_02409 [Pistacia integerrima]|uniref:Uncharacterized protein n=1 Tax=Pistacia integerrima TaxID=434235 RepID=A0ACC0ZPE1_9ROSI|nr:hypothetical protein Pint_02409 [Pistacia integerrima]
MKARKEKEKLSMETYIVFILSHKQIAMHGFKRINKAPSSVLMNAVKALDVMDPSRSTLNENISPFASITLNHILADLNELFWQECCITSIDVFNNTDISPTSNASASPSTSTPLYVDLRLVKYHVTKLQSEANSSQQPADVSDGVVTRPKRNLRMPARLLD